MRAALRSRDHSRPRSRHQRYGVGCSQYEVLWRVLESKPCYRYVFEDGTRFRQHANEILGRRIQRVVSWETDPAVYYQSPHIPKPYYDPDCHLPKKRQRRV